MITIAIKIILYDYFGSSGLLFSLQICTLTDLEILINFNFSFNEHTFKLKAIKINNLLRNQISKVQSEISENKLYYQKYL